ncbi:PP0621 family protein [Methylophaga sp.]|jgi:uncharacterized protein|uniref:PP0621 family protein n=1 Tax=Methylophaga sp. TaxID=2024840 RepID=UPI003A8DFB42
MRILILLAIGLLLYVIFRNLYRQIKNERQIEQAEKMVRCEQCGLHLLEQEAIQKNQHFFCTTEHLEAYQQHK